MTRIFGAIVTVSSGNVVLIETPSIINAMPSYASSLVKPVPRGSPYLDLFRCRKGPTSSSSQHPSFPPHTHGQKPLLQIQSHMPRMVKNQLAWTEEMAQCAEEHMKTHVIQIRTAERSTCNFYGKQRRRPRKDELPY